MSKTYTQDQLDKKIEVATKKAEAAVLKSVTAAIRETVKPRIESAREEGFKDVAKILTSLSKDLVVAVKAPF